MRVGISEVQRSGAYQGLRRRTSIRSRFAGIRVSTWIHIRNAFVAAEYSMSVSRNAHLLMRSPPHERFTYVALPTRFALTGRGLRTQHHITGKTTFRTLCAPAHKVREIRPPGSVRGALSNEHSYRDSPNLTSGRSEGLQRSAGTQEWQRFEGSVDPA